MWRELSMFVKSWEFVLWGKVTYNHKLLSILKSLFTVLILQRNSRYTCQECIEGLEWVGGYMSDPLWVAEYTLYLEENFCSTQTATQRFKIWNDGFTIKSKYHSFIQMC